MPIEGILGRVPSGLFVLTIRHAGQETGMLSSWVMQAGFDPPMVTVAVRHGRYIAAWLHAGAEFALNLLSERDKPLLSHFGRGFEPGQPAFDGLEIDRSRRGIPLLRSALGYFECVPRKHVDSGDHAIFLAEILDGELYRPDSPLVHIRNSGKHY